MPTLIFKAADGTEQKAQLEGELSVGRDADNDVILKDQGVSRRHCRFYVDESGGVVVEDLGSANGVLVNGERIAEPTAVTDEAEVLIATWKVLVARRQVALVRKAVVRSNGAKPVPAAPTGKRPTRMMTASEMPARPAPRAAGRGRPPPAAEDDRAQLRGLTGPWAGKVFDLEGLSILVGRVAPAQVLVDDDSVSRRHAELSVSGDRVEVRDLESANGTFVNGERVKRVTLCPGDVLRFGVVEFTYTGPGPTQVANNLMRRKRLVLFGGVGAALVLGLLVVALLASPPGPSPQGGGEVGGGGTGQGGPEAPEPGEADAAKLLSRCKAFSDRESELVNWAKAIEVCGSAYRADPLLAEARQLEALAKKEREAELKLQDALKRASTSQEEAALKLLVEVPSDTSSFLQARTAFVESAERVAKRKRSECKTYLRVGEAGRALEDCRRSLEVTCNRPEGLDGETKKLFDDASRRLGRKPDFTCPPEYARFQGGVIVEQDVDAENKLRAKYTDKLIGDQMLSYYREGRAKMVADRLKRMFAKDPKRFKDGAINDLIVQLELIDGNYMSGQEGLMRNQPERAEEHWKVALEADAALMGDAGTSFLANEMRVRLAEGFQRAGIEALKQSYAKGFQLFYRGHQYDKNNQEIVTQLHGMESHSKRVLAESKDCGELKTVLEINAEGSALYQKAVQVREELGCP